MPVLSRANIAAPTVPKETVQIDELGGEVVVKALGLTDLLELTVREGSTFSKVASTLALTVVDAEGLPIFTVEEWETFGSQHVETALKLVNVAQRLSGMGGDPKEQAPS